MDEFDLITRCFGERATRRPGTVLGIGDDAALLDTGARPLSHAQATATFSESGDPAGFAYRVFGAAFIRLAACAVAPRWATLGLTLEASGTEWIERFAAATAAVCDACGVELIGGDTTRGPGRATVFALGTANTSPPRLELQRPTAAITVRLPLDAANAPEMAIAELVSTCAVLAGSGAALRCGGGPEIGGEGRTLEFIAHADSAGLGVLRAAAGRGNLVDLRVENNG